MPPRIRTNVEVWAIQSVGIGLYFLPDRLLVRQKGRYAAVSYDALQVASRAVTYIENGWYPRDAEIVQWHWMRVNKDGSRDQRFKNNGKVPEMRYEEVSLTSTNGLSIDLYVSKRTAGWQFKQMLAKVATRSSANQGRQQSQSEYDYARGQEQEYQRQKEHEQQRQRQQKPPPPPSKTDLERAYELLYVQPGAPIDIAEAAYKKLMKKAHPDVGGTDEQARELTKAIETIRQYGASKA